MDYDQLCDLKDDVMRASILSRLLDGETAIFVRVSPWPSGRPEISITTDLDGIRQELEKYLARMIDDLKERGYTGDFSEIVLD